MTSASYRQQTEVENKRQVIIIGGSRSEQKPRERQAARMAHRPKAAKLSFGPSINKPLIVMNLLVLLMLKNRGSWPRTLVTWRQQPTDLNAGYTLLAEAVVVQRLKVPDLVVIDQLNQQQQQTRMATTLFPQTTAADQLSSRPAPGINLNGQSSSSSSSQPEAASLINIQDLSAASNGSSSIGGVGIVNNNELQQIKFECLISFDRRKDKNLIVKWHHDDRIEPIYQWIPELNKRSIAPQYRAYIAPIVSNPQLQQQQASDTQQSSTNITGINQGNAHSSNQSSQLLEAGFRLVRPSKELGGKYTCSAISTQNDDSKWKKMIVFTPPRAFKFNATRTDIGALLASQRERLIQPSMIGPVSSFSTSSTNQLPLAYRMRGLDGQQTTISPQMYSTIDYVNVNQQRTRQSASLASSPWLVAPPTHPPLTANSPLDAYSSRLQLNSAAHGYPMASTNLNRQQSAINHQKHQQANGVKLVCDIDQVFPVPEVSIYKLAKLDGSHPEKLAKLDTKIERNLVTGLYHVQVISILEDDELQMKYGFNEPVYFECLIALTNLELSKYSDNKRSIIYRPGLQSNSQIGAQQSSEDISLNQAGNSANRATDFIIIPRSKALTLSLVSLLLMSWLVTFTNMMIQYDRREVV